jgi:hypothetical protein
MKTSSKKQMCDHMAISFINIIVFSKGVGEGHNVNQPSFLIELNSDFCCVWAQQSVMPIYEWDWWNSPNHIRITLGTPSKRWSGFGQAHSHIIKHPCIRVNRGIFTDNKILKVSELSWLRVPAALHPTNEKNPSLPLLLCVYIRVQHVLHVASQLTHTHLYSYM